MAMASIASIAALEGGDVRISSASDRLEALKKARLAGGAASKTKLEEAAQDFEAQFLSQMLENMFSTVEVNPDFGGGQGEEVYRSLLINEYGKIIARTGGIGVADHVKKELLRLQEAR